MPIESAICVDGSIYLNLMIHECVEHPDSLDPPGI
jgi:hypothetical protein